MQNRRKIIVINKKFQHQYALLFVACTVLFTNLLIILGALYPGTEPFNLTLGMSVTIGLIELALMAGVWQASLRLTHKIAGPVYVFQRDIQKFAEGDYSVRIHLRTGDAFQEEAEAINASLEKLESAIRELKGSGAA